MSGSMSVARGLKSRRFGGWRVRGSNVAMTTDTSRRAGGRSHSAPAFRFGRESAAAMGAASGEWSVQWFLQRNCSLAPTRLLKFYRSMCVLSLGIAGFCWAQGPRMVMPFAWLELLA